MYTHLTDHFGQPLIVKMRDRSLVHLVPRKIGEQAGLPAVVGKDATGHELVLPAATIDSLHGNPNNLLGPIVHASLFDDYVPGGNITSSQLVGPPQIDQLWQRHRWEVVGEIDDLAWRVLGRAAHEVLRHADPENALIEERLGMQVQGPLGWWEVTSQIDRYGETHLHLDWKFCSVFSFMLGDKPEWHDKIQVGTAIIEHNTFAVERSVIVALFRDWSHGKALYDKQYPQSPWHIQEIPIWPPEYAQAYIEERVALHQLARNIPDDRLPPCTNAERWTRDEAYAIIKPNAKKALKLFKVKDFQDETRPQAAAHQAALAHQAGTGTPDEYSIEHRPGTHVRCELYCPCAPVCQQWRREREKQAGQASMKERVDAT